jgi:hypothetical protein
MLYLGRITCSVHRFSGSALQLSNDDGATWHRHPRLRARERPLGDVEPFSSAASCRPGNSIGTVRA